MFLQFEKYTTAEAGGQSAILVDLDRVLLIAPDVIFDPINRCNIDVTRVEVVCSPKLTFYTSTPISSIASEIGGIDASGGATSSGSSCLGTAGLLDIVTPTITTPMISVQAILNSTATATGTVMFNPNYLVYAETVDYTDLGTTRQAQALLIVLDDVQAKKILTTLAFEDLVTLLGPLVIS